MLLRWFLWGLLVGMLGAPLAPPELLPCSTRTYDGDCIDSIGRPVHIYALRFVRGTVILRLHESWVRFDPCGEAAVRWNNEVLMLQQGEYTVVER